MRVLLAFIVCSSVVQAQSRYGSWGGSGSTTIESLKPLAEPQDVREYFGIQPTEEDLEKSRRAAAYNRARLLERQRKLARAHRSWRKQNPGWPYGPNKVRSPYNPRTTQRIRAAEASRRAKAKRRSRSLKRGYRRYGNYRGRR